MKGKKNYNEKTARKLETGIFYGSGFGMREWGPRFRVCWNAISSGGGVESDHMVSVSQFAESGDGLDNHSRTLKQ